MDARPRPRTWMIAERIVLTVWVGALWAIGYLAVPIVFNVLDDRVLAGRLAGEMFRMVNILGLVCGGVLLASAIASSGLRGLRAWRSIVIGAMMLVAGVILFVLQPQMAALKAEAATMGTTLAPAFGRLHGISSAIYLLASLLGGFLVASGPQAQVRER